MKIKMKAKYKFIFSGMFIIGIITLIFFNLPKETIIITELNPIKLKSILIP